MTQRLILANAQLVLPGEVVTGALTLEGGKIAAIDTGSTVGEGIDCGGDYLAPGLIELHTDNLERHIQPRPKVDWPHAAAILAHDGELASTGITTVFDAMRVGSIPRPDGGYAKYARALASELLEMRAKGTLRISHFLHLRAEVCSETLIAEMAEFGPDDRVGIVSLMDHTPGQRQFRDVSKLKAYVMGKGGMDEAGFAAHIADLHSLRETYGEAHEAAAVSEAARYGAILASHDDTTAEHVAVSKDYGVTFAEFPTTQEAAQACRAAGIAVMMGAPNLIRGGSHSGNVAAGDLARAGLLDIVSSDYVPAALLMSVVKLQEIWGNMARAMATVTMAPAAAAGLTDRGQLTAGLRGDAVRFAIVDGTAVVRGVWSQGRQVG